MSKRAFNVESGSRCQIQTPFDIEFKPSERPCEPSKWEEGRLGTREDEPVDGGGKRGFSGLQVAGIAPFCVLANALPTVWAVRIYLDPSEFEPLALSAGEQSGLDTKLAVEEGRFKIRLRE
jgi:hypothetical protein